MPGERFISYGHEIVPEWIDAYDHMNMAHYMALFDQVADELLDQVGFGPTYTARTRHGLFTVDARIRYAREVRVGQSVAVSLRLVGVDHVRLHMWLEMSGADPPTVFATQEQMSLHASLETRRSVPFDAAQRARLEEVVALHRSDAEHATRPLCMRVKE
jgi:acyl-CoA thioester hydrolase